MRPLFALPRLPVCQIPDPVGCGKGPGQDGLVRLRRRARPALGIHPRVVNLWIIHTLERDRVRLRREEAERVADLARPGDERGGDQEDDGHDTHDRADELEHHAVALHRRVLRRGQDLFFFYSLGIY